MNRLPSFIFRMALAAAWMVMPMPALVVPPSSGPQPAVSSGEPVEPPYEHISPADEQAMLDEIRRNLAALRATGALAAPDAAQTVTYDFPLRMAPGLPDHAGFRVSAFADHNPVSGQVLDYSGGARTYDGHHGTDYALWPFSWNKLDAGAVQVIAAAAGTIVARADVNPADHNCGPSSSGNWNYVALAHADGRMTIYGHMRYNSLTRKGIGQTVAQGEYLGTVASSGNSSGPHLHFEVRAASFSAEWIDPYAGPNSQPESFWTSQRPYFDSAINRLATHSAPPSTPDACQPSITNLQDSFTTPGNIYFYTYYRDYQQALVTQLNVYRPDGSVFQSWQDVPADSTFYSGATRARALAFSAAEPAGTWRFEAIYNGQVYETFFNVNAPPVVTLGSPNGGEQWDRQLTHSVTWTDNLGGQVNIELYRNGVYSATIVSSTPSDGEFLWAPDPAQVPGTGYSMRVISVINPAVYDESDAPFTIQPIPPPNLSLTQTASVPNPQPGQFLNYIMTLGNNGLGAATGARLTDPLPAGLAQAGPITLNPPGLGTAGTLPEAVVRLTLAAGQSLTVTIPVIVNQGQPAGTLITNTAVLTSTEVVTPITASIVITLADAPLVARNDLVITPMATPVAIDALGNDGDPNGDPLAITALGQPLSGTVSLLGAHLLYTPTLGFIGADVLTYTVSTSTESSSATVTVIVAAEVSRLFLPLIRR